MPSGSGATSSVRFLASRSWIAQAERVPAASRRVRARARPRSRRPSRCGSRPRSRSGPGGLTGVTSSQSSAAPRMKIVSPSRTGEPSSRRNAATGKTKLRLGRGRTDPRGRDADRRRPPRAAVPPRGVSERNRPDGAVAADAVLEERTAYPVEGHRGVRFPILGEDVDLDRGAGGQYDRIATGRGSGQRDDRHRVARPGDVDRPASPSSRSRP